MSGDEKCTSCSDSPGKDEERIIRTEEEKSVALKRRH